MSDLSMQLTKAMLIRGDHSATWPVVVFLLQALVAYRPDTPLDQSMLLEIDVASFTRNEAAQDEVPLGNQGKFLGLLDR